MTITTAAQAIVDSLGHASSYQRWRKEGTDTHFVMVYDGGTSKLTLTIHPHLWLTEARLNNAPLSELRKGDEATPSQKAVHAAAIRWATVQPKSADVDTAAIALLKA